MCGIVGYTGKRKIVPILLDGLFRLEYRGYDSAGIALSSKESEGSLNIIKEVGKIAVLEKKVRQLQLTDANACAGIAHTRWATHGKVTSQNAHPHFDPQRRFAVVHNGIIENYLQLKAKLSKEGYKFTTETDSEVIVALISKYYKGNLEDAVRESMTKVIGAYGIAVICCNEPGKIVGARNGSPLILGVGKDENVLASDILAIRSITDNVVYLDDGQMVVVTKDGYSISTLERKEVTATVHIVDWDIGNYERGNFSTFMEKEIHEQAKTIIDTTRGRLLTKEGLIRLGGLEDYTTVLKKVKKITIVACGTSWHAALIGKYWIENLSGVPVDVEYAAEFRYRNPIILDDHIVIAMSQSGETADTLGAVREAKVKGALVFGITNVVGSTIARETNAGVYLHAGPEIGVASTKAFTGQLTVLLMVAMLLGRMRRLSIEDVIKISNAFEKIPSKIEKILSQKDKIAKIAESVKDYSNALYLGRGTNFPVALEGALKLKEISYIHAEGYPAAEMKHGPIALIDDKMPSVVIAAQDFLYEKILSNIQEIKARNGQVIGIATEGDQKIAESVDHVIYIPETLDILLPFLTVIPLQYLAYSVAILRGLDVDKPRNLAKSVTVE